MKTLIVYCAVFIAFGVGLVSCNDKQIDIGPVTDTINILSLEASSRSIKAWDTTTITVVAAGEHLQYYWEANHGDINGSGAIVKYAAGNCCLGINTITCRVFNENGYVEDTIQIRVRHYFDD
jgi:hypothetical protein